MNDDDDDDDDDDDGGDGGGYSFPINPIPWVILVLDGRYAIHVR